MLWILIPLILFLIVLYKGWMRTLLYWEHKGVEGPKPWPLLGNMLDQILGKKSFGEMGVEWAVQSGYKSTFIGIHNFMSPTLLIYDPKYVEVVLIKEFSHFQNRVLPSDKEVNLFDQTLFNYSGAKWKAFRTKLAPVFSSGKLKHMVPKMRGSLHNCFKYLKENNSNKVEAKDIATIYSIDVIGNVAFGFESSELSSPNSEFTRMGRKMFEFTWKRFFTFVLVIGFPKIAEFFKVPFVPTKLVNYFKNIIEEAFKQRRATGMKRNDFVQLLLELRDRGRVDVQIWDAEDGYLKTSDQQEYETVEITDNAVISQALIFMTTGFDTVSSSLIFTILELTQNPREMDRLVQEIDRVMAVHKDYTFEALKDMEHLEKCILEAMRIHPVVETILRVCSKNYKFDTGLEVEKNTFVAIPVLAIHTNPNIYPDPLKFKPDRFDTPPSPGTYLPFGDGPRVCIAKRFAMLEMKMLLAKLFYTYQVRLNSQTKLPVGTEKLNFLTKPNTPVYLNLTRRTKTLSDFDILN